jgi:hypothetical protein
LLEQIAPALFICLRISKVSALLTTRLMVRCLLLLPYCSGAKLFVHSATFIISLPTCLKAKLQSTGKSTMVLRLDNSVTPDFLSNMTSTHYFQHLGAKPTSRGILVMVQSNCAIRSLEALAFIVENDSAQGKQVVSSLAFFQNLW